MQIQFLGGLLFFKMIFWIVLSHLALVATCPAQGINTKLVNPVYYTQVYLTDTFCTLN